MSRQHSRTHTSAWSKDNKLGGLVPVVSLDKPKPSLLDWLKKDPALLFPRSLLVGTIVLIAGAALKAARK